LDIDRTARFAELIRKPLSECLVKCTNQTLTKLSVAHSDFPDPDPIRYAQWFSALRHLDLLGYHDEITNEMLLCLGGCCTRLVFFGCSLIPSRACAGLEAMLRVNPDIRDLRLRSLEQTAVPEATSLILRHCLKVTSLRLSGWYVTDDVLKALADSCCYKLAHFHLTSADGGMTEQGVGYLLERCRRLRVVSLVHCSSLSEQFVAQVGRRYPAEEWD
jgi:hypothetical protein